MGLIAVATVNWKYNRLGDERGGLTRFAQKNKAAGLFTFPQRQWDWAIYSSNQRCSCIDI
jgi:hypothetical protein